MILLRYEKRLVILNHQFLHRIRKFIKQKIPDKNIFFSFAQLPNDFRHTQLKCQDEQGNSCYNLSL